MKMFKIVLSLLFLCSFVATVSATTYDGEINPADIEKSTHCFRTTLNVDGLPVVMCKIPTMESESQDVYVIPYFITTEDGIGRPKVFRYWYRTANGEIHIFQYDSEKDHFEEIEIP